MSKLDEIFIINGLGDIEINKEEVKEHPYYKTIYYRSKPCKGDFDGKKKVMAYKEFLYMYLVNNPKSMYKSLPEELRKEKAFEHCDMPKGWYEDKDYTICAAEYRKGLRLSSKANSYLSADKALMNLTIDLNMENDLLQSYKIMLSKLVAIVKEAEGDVTKVANIKDATALISAITEIQDKQVKIIEKLPKLSTVVNELYSAYVDEEGGNKSVVGGGEVSNREE